MITRAWQSVVLGLAVACTPAAADTEPAEFAGMVEAHNVWRRIVKVPELRWSDANAVQAQGWANQLASEGCAMRYNPDPLRKERFGENIMKAWGGEPYQGYRRQPQQVVDRWGEEGRYYDLATDTCNAPPGRICGHYTQLTWDETTHVGCGRARCEKSEVWVCNYTPRGNKADTRPYGNAPKQSVLPPEEPAPLACYAVGHEPSFDRPAAQATQDER